MKLILTIFLISFFFNGCGDKSGPAPTGTSKLSNYVGNWYKNCASGTFATQKTLLVGSSGSYSQTVQEYDSTSNCGVSNNLSSTKLTTGTITSVLTNSSNTTYDTVYVSSTEVQVTPNSIAQASTWNSEGTDGHCGLQTWISGTTKTFNSVSPGVGSQSTCFLTSFSFVVKKEGTLLDLNERGGFDGSDPSNDVYYVL